MRYSITLEKPGGIRVAGCPTQEEWDYLYPLAIVFAQSGGREVSHQTITEAADVLAWSFNNMPAASTFN